MRKTIILSILCVAAFIANIPKTAACDVCGCGVGSYYLGILPDFNKRFIGLRYQQNRLQTHLGSNGIRTPNSTNEIYRTMELWGAWNFGERWRAMAIVPYSFNERSIGNSGLETGKKNGLGDVVIMGHYKVFDDARTTTSYKLLMQSLWVGAGIKTPTGEYDTSEQSSAEMGAPNNFQLGTVSTDFMVNAAYDIRLMDAGLNVNATYKINTENKHDYRYANKLTVNALAYYKFNIKNKIRISPNAGVLYETQPKDVLYNRFDIAQSGGHSAMGIAGVEINVGAISIGGNFQTPISQNLADGRIKAENRFMTHVSFSF
ncbi:transporter [Sphingobacterium phlebotomi]|uniref:Transporter n=1 Tax=Sphingobacterium phlebotomi TaxID=2605433 RepID=A0A5D4GSH8_9SPHI|nr:transporter [Sphingobacterium phlebotomi]TYR31706.1 transporter [Sphingobacterium phlebotomi]